jgi:hypothetical protein
MSGIPDKVVELLLGDLDEEPDSNEAQGREAEEQFVELIRGGPFHRVELLSELSHLGKQIRKGVERERISRRPIIVAADQIDRSVALLLNRKTASVALGCPVKSVVCFAGTRQQDVDGSFHLSVLIPCPITGQVSPYWARDNARRMERLALILCSPRT